MQVRHMTAEEHRSKRKFQPSITSYFEVRDDFEEHDDLRGLDPITRLRHHPHQHHQRERLAPEVPGQVQTDLLNVGMRVRKSVPEGYKTHKMSALPSIQTALSSKPTLEVKPPREAVPGDSVHQRELLPFCGLHKVGGMGFAEQPTTNPHLYGRATSSTRPPNAFPLQPEAFTQPFSSHNSFSSASSSSSSITRPNNPSKRSWQDEDEVRSLDTSFFFAIPNTKGMGMGVEVDEVPVSPLSETPTMGLNALPPTRQYAKPRSRRGMGERTISDEDIDMDFENATHIEGRVGAGCGSDFEEADFLTREVAMGGI
jgi:hypothetical protein